MLWRLNHELLPDPGRPIASTTVPLLARAGADAECAGSFAATAGAGADDFGADDSVAAASAVGSAAAGVCAARGVRERDPPRPPRLRRRRAGRGLPCTS